MASEFDQEREVPGTSDALGDGAATKLFIMIKSMSRVAYARDLRLRDEDIIVAIDGVLNVDDIISFNARFDQLLEKQEKLLLTICRNEVIYDILVEDKLGVELGFADSEASAIAQKLFAQHDIGLKDHYQNYEALRDVHRHVVLYDTEYSAIATLAPPIWLLQHRAWEPLAAVIAVYATSAVVNWWAFVATALLLAIYFHRIQFRIIRSYSLFTEHFFWHVCAARTSAEAQLVCRQLDPKCHFDFSYVGPPTSTTSNQEPA
ncbi:hypothetical protein N9M78_01120 [Alphaproteobacteria bacterium]|nr:hypothetical protein [Alphaproteobacteria bacterium]